mmetsp:Transcript_80129/g.230017  ORF Transcript_80129/g.230017 Transcript_80129/m.230017 type:complete len:203 (+) Transcript_80129:478-1086(+)
MHVLDHPLGIGLLREADQRRLVGLARLIREDLALSHGAVLREQFSDPLLCVIHRQARNEEVVLRVGVAALAATETAAQRCAGRRHDARGGGHLLDGGHGAGCRRAAARGRFVLGPGGVVAALEGDLTALNELLAVSELVSVYEDIGSAAGGCDKTKALIIHPSLDGALQGLVRRKLAACDAHRHHRRHACGSHAKTAKPLHA